MDMIFLIVGVLLLAMCLILFRMIADLDRRVYDLEQSMGSHGHTWSDLPVFKADPYAPKVSSTYLSTSAPSGTIRQFGEE